MSGNRKSPWPFYLCGRKKREGWQACPSGKIGAREPEEAVLQVVTRRVLTPDFVSALVAEVNGLMNRHVPTVQGQMDEARRQLAGIDDGHLAAQRTAQQVAVHRPGADLQALQQQAHSTSALLS